MFVGNRKLKIHCSSSYCFDMLLPGLKITLKLFYSNHGVIIEYYYKSNTILIKSFVGEKF